MRFSLILLLFSSNVCFGQYNYGPEQYSTPPQDTLKNWAKMDGIDISRVIVDPEFNEVEYYYKENQKANGWAETIDPKTTHRFRYSYYQNGKLRWQIGYFENGVLGHDFRMALGGNNFGRSRMWMEDGHPYIDQFYTEQGVMDGLQKRWHQNHMLANESFYDNGDLVWKIDYDTFGNITAQEGEKPE